MQSTLLIGQDITEKLKLEETARKTYHLAQLGQLSAGIAHEINNPNHIILSSSQMIGDIWGDIENILSRYYLETGDFLVGGIPWSKVRADIPKMISRTKDCSQRIADIVANLKDYVGQEKNSPDEKLSIKNVIAAALSMLSREIAGSTDNFRVDLAEDLPCITGNSNALSQVIINIVMNSLQALPDRRCGVTITSGYCDKEDCIAVQIRDEGIGMSKDVLDMAFKPFFTTKHGSGGTGLGLSISRTIIQKHKGDIEFQTTPGKGTTTTIKLPVRIHD